MVVVTSKIGRNGERLTWVVHCCQQATALPPPSHRVPSVRPSSWSGTAAVCPFAGRQHWKLDGGAAAAVYRKSCSCLLPNDSNWWFNNDKINGMLIFMQISGGKSAFVFHRCLASLSVYSPGAFVSLVRFPQSSGWRLCWWRSLCDDKLHSIEGKPPWVIFLLFGFSTKWWSFAEKLKTIKWSKKLELWLWTWLGKWMVSEVTEQHFNDQLIM